jgi:hypothetical protein
LDGDGASDVASADEGAIGGESSGVGGVGVVVLPEVAPVEARDAEGGGLCGEEEEGSALGAALVVGECGGNGGGHAADDVIRAPSIVQVLLSPWP